MNLSNNTVLITGGATGIGLAMAEQYLNAGSTVIICARKKGKLDEAKAKFPSLHTYVCDVLMKMQREELAKWVTANFPDLNILVNNAGIQRQNNFVKGADFVSASEEIETNFTAYVHFSALFIPHLMTKKNAAIINIGSGLGFIPIARMPIYGATKAAIHSFSWSLRYQLKDTPVRVFEIIPPTVDTDLDHDTRPASFRGISVHDFITEAMDALGNDIFEAPIGMAKGLHASARENPDEAFLRINR